MKSITIDHNHTAARLGELGVLSWPLLVIIFVFFTSAVGLCQSPNGKPATEPVTLDRIATYLGNEMVKEWEADVDSWTSQNAIAAYSKIEFNDKMIQKLYGEYKRVVVAPPDPDVTPVVFTAGEKERLRERALAWKLHNMLQAMPEPAYNRYSTVVAGMRQILYIGQKYLPETAKKDYSHDVIWWTFHKDWTIETDAAYAELFPGQ
jgi:hypothetical protein